MAKRKQNKDVVLPPTDEELCDIYGCSLNHLPHQIMLRRHHEEKIQRRETHRARHFERSIIPILLV
jgi:hypothetical protein